MRTASVLQAPTQSLVELANRNIPAFGSQQGPVAGVQPSSQAPAAKAQPSSQEAAARWQTEGPLEPAQWAATEALTELLSLTAHMAEDAQLLVDVGSSSPPHLALARLNIEHRLGEQVPNPQPSRDCSGTYSEFGSCRKPLVTNRGAAIASCMGNLAHATPR